MSLTDSLKWRYATKRMNGEKVPAEKLEAILTATQLSASSQGLQPYTILVISNPEIKAKLQPAAYGQAQIVECSHLLVFCAWTNITEKEVDEYMNDVAAKRGIPVEALTDFKAMVQGGADSKTVEERQNWAAKQAYIALGTALAAAAEERVDATGMEGFSPAEFDTILGLEEKGLKSVVLVALGYRDAANDRLASAAKVRRDKEKLFQFIN